jgi:diaminopimelate decarboxylase
MLNDSIRYQSGELYCDAVPVREIATQTGTPVYVYSLSRALANLARIRAAFTELNPEIHYSAKANSNLTLLRALHEAGVGVDAVSEGEIRRAIYAGVPASEIVFAGVGKTFSELQYAIQAGVGWINVENVLELEYINQIAMHHNRRVRVALRLNPDVTAATHKYIATGHGYAKFGLSIETVQALLARQDDYPSVEIVGLHIHIGSQLHDTAATRRAVEVVLECLAPYPHIRHINIGGGLAVAYRADEPIPSWESFANAVTPLLKGYAVILEPGRSIIADAGMLVVSTLYTKQQGQEHILISDGSMAELIRPALYEAHHEIIPVMQAPASQQNLAYHVVGPVCESADALGHHIPLPVTQAGDLLAVLTAGAYGMVMASNYNQRLRPPEVMVMPDGKRWQITRRRETWDDLLREEVG